MSLAATAAAPRAGSPTFLGSTVGKKIVMAGTGIVLFGFVLIHMIGNLQLYLGPAALNAYGELLRSLLHGAGLWIARATLLACVGGHIWAAVSLTFTNRDARPLGYRQWKAQESTYSGRTMRWSGFIVLFFILFHLAHFTTGQVHPTFVPGDVYGNVVSGFSNPLVSGFYIIAMLCLGLHLRHAVWSLMQTLGWNHPRYNFLRQLAAAGFATVIVVANISFPVMVLAGVVK